MSNLLTQQLAQWNEVIYSRPNEPKAYIQRGMVNFKLANIDASIADFDTAEQLDKSLTPYLWQRGLSYYYAGKFVEGAKQFEIDLTVNSQDVEETIWRYLCLAQIQDSTKSSKLLLPVKNDPRPIMGRIYNLYAGNASINDILTFGNPFDKRVNFYSHLYVGLYCEANNESAQAQHYITKSVKKYQIDDYMWHVAHVHQKLRGWK